jgi:hypothetical protein
MKRHLCLFLLVALPLLAAEPLVFHPGINASPTAAYRTRTVYGRLTGPSAVPESGRTYAEPAMGRTGRLDALRTGTSGDGIAFRDFRLRPGQPFTLELSLFLYPNEQRRSGDFLNCLNSFGGGFLFSGWQIPHQQGPTTSGFNFGAATDQGRKTVKVKQFPAGVWHHLAVVSDTQSLRLYLDGNMAGKLPGALKLPAGGAVVEFAKARHDTKTPNEFKLDYAALHPEALTAEAIASRHKARPVSPAATPEREVQLRQIKIELPANRYGLFTVGESIPLKVEAPGADSLSVDGKSYPLPLAEPLQLRFDSPGRRTVTVAVAKGNEERCRREFPLVITLKAPQPGLFAANDLFRQQPESIAYGVRLSRETVLWNRLETKSGEYDFDELDAIVDRNTAAGIETVINCTGRPRWVTFPKDLGAYAKLWELLAARYDNVRYLEVGGAEANWLSAHAKLGEAEKLYAQLLAVASTAIRKINPNIKIVAGKYHWQLRPHQAAAFAKAHAADFDILSLNWEPAAPAKEFAALKRSVATAGKPVWLTTGSATEPADKATEAMQAASLEIARLALARAAGVTTYFLSVGPMSYGDSYSLANGTPGARAADLAKLAAKVAPGATFTVDNAARPTAVAYRNPDGSAGTIRLTTEPVVIE